MNPSNTDRSKKHVLTDLPNIGPSIVEDLRVVGIQAPKDLVGRNPLELYALLNTLTRTRRGSCILDVLLSVTDDKAGNEAQPWWAYSKERKKLLADEN